MGLRIDTASGTYDMPSSFGIDVEDTSPIFNEQGSRTVATELPHSARNAKLTKYIYRLDNALSPASDTQVSIHDGPYRRKGTMNIIQISKKNSTANIGFDESEIYSLMSSVSLRSLDGLPILQPSGGVTDLIYHMNEVMSEKRAEPFHVFQICVALPSTESNGVEHFYPEYLNKEISGGMNDYILDASARTETYLIDSSVVETKLPAGYGITGFLKVSWILNKIFEHFGYTLEDNPFENDPQLSRLVVLNNSADAIVKGSLNYVDMLPDCTVNEFLQALYCRFGNVYFINGQSKTVRCKLIDEIVSSPGSDDWSNLKASNPTIYVNEPKQLKLSAATSINGAATVISANPATDSFKKFLLKYDNTVSSSLGQGYLSYWSPTGTFYERGIVSGERKSISSDFFPWDQGDTISYEDISSIDECLPMKADGPDDGLHCPAYLFGKQHKYTNIESSDVEIDAEETFNTPLCFCFKVPPSAWNYPIGSPRCYTPSGNLIPGFEFSMTFVGDHGLFNRFWRKYDAILRWSNNTVETNINLHHAISSVDMSKPIVIDGQRLLVDTVRYTLPLKRSQPATVRLRTLRLLQPYNLSDQQIILSEQKYKWKFISTKEGLMAAKRANYLASITPAAGYRITRAEDVAVSENPVTDDEIPFTIPSQSDYDAGTTMFIRTVHYSYKLYYYSQKWNASGYWEPEERSNNPLSGEIDYDTSIKAVGIND